MNVNVGTIGHIDHGKATLGAALAKLGAVLVRDEDIQIERVELSRLAELDALETISYPSAFGRKRRDDRKAARKARMLDLQRRAFTGEASK